MGGSPSPLLQAAERRLNITNSTGHIVGQQIDSCRIGSRCNPREHFKPYAAQTIELSASKLFLTSFRNLRVGNDFAGSATHQSNHSAGNIDKGH
jgi:hypothetical protein